MWHFAIFAVLRFGAQFNQSLSQTVLPEELRSLTFGWRFNHDGTQFPKKLESLTFGHHFCQSVAGVDWPESLQCLSFGFWFNPSLRLWNFCIFSVFVHCVYLETGFRSIYLTNVISWWLRGISAISCTYVSCQLIQPVILWMPFWSLQPKELGRGESSCWLKEAHHLWSKPGRSWAPQRFGNIEC